MKAFTLAAAAATLFASVNAAVDPIVIKGSKFFYKTNGTQFFIKGVAYQRKFHSALHIPWAGLTIRRGCQYKHVADTEPRLHRSPRR
jgi:hypothetical protein